MWITKSPKLGVGSATNFTRKVFEVHGAKNLPKNMASLVTEMLGNLSLKGNLSSSFLRGERKLSVSSLPIRQPGPFCPPLKIEAAHKKGSGSTKNGRDSQAKRLGVKIYGDQAAKPGNIIIRQRGTNVSQ